EVANVRCLGVVGKRKGEPHPHRCAVGTLSFPLEPEQLVVANVGPAERLAVAYRVAAFEHEHRKPLAVCEKAARKVAEGEGARPWRRDILRLDDCQQLDEKSRQLDDAVMGPPGMAIAGTYREPEAAVKRGRRIEIVYRMNDVVETTGHGALPSSF